MKINISWGYSIKKWGGELLILKLGNHISPTKNSPPPTSLFNEMAL